MGRKCTSGIDPDMALDKETRGSGERDRTTCKKLHRLDYDYDHLTPKLLNHNHLEYTNWSHHPLQKQRLNL